MEGAALGAGGLVVTAGADVADAAVVEGAEAAGVVGGAALGDGDLVGAGLGLAIVGAGLPALACPLPGSSTAPTTIPMTNTSTTATMVIPVLKLIPSSQWLTASSTRPRPLRRA